jgi:Rod binding domain-containing protein
MSGLNPIDTSLLPAEVRNGTPRDRELYTAALAFEQQLTRQLAQSLVDATQPQDGDSSSSDEDDSSSQDGSSNQYAQMLPDALTQSVTSDGGLGLAPQLWRALGGGAK